MNLAADAASSLNVPPWAWIVVALLGSGFLGRFLTNFVNRRNAHADERNAMTADVAETNAGMASTATTTALRTLERQVESNDRRMTELQTRHDREIADVKEDNKTLSRKVEDLRRNLDEYRIGKLAPKGFVLIPIYDISVVRREHPGVLPRGFYPGEDEEHGLGGIDARITPLPPRP